MSMSGGGRWVYPLGFNEDRCSDRMPSPFPRRNNESTLHSRLKKAVGRIVLSAGWRVGFEVSSPGGGIADVIVHKDSRAAAFEIVVSSGSYRLKPPDLTTAFPTFWLIHPRAGIAVADHPRMLRIDGSIDAWVLTRLDTVPVFEMSLPDAWDLVCNRRIVEAAYRDELEQKCATRVKLACDVASSDSQYGSSVRRMVGLITGDPKTLEQEGLKMKYPYYSEPSEGGE